MRPFVVRTSSWHYRLYRWFKDTDNSEPTNLCSYFWALVGYSVLMVVIDIPLAIVAGIFAVAYGLVMAPVALVALIRRRPMPWNKAEVKRAKAGRETQRQPGLIRSFLAAKKARVCPLVVIERDEA